MLEDASMVYTDEYYQLRIINCKGSGEGISNYDNNDV
jgi:threonyl-tRNA synthetase